MRCETGECCHSSPTDPHPYPHVPLSSLLRYVLQDGSPYARSMKQMSKEKLKARRSRTAFEEVEEDLRLSLHLQDQDSVKDAVPDQQLDFKQLLARYQGNVLPRGILQLCQR